MQGFPILPVGPGIPPQAAPYDILCEGRKTTLVLQVVGVWVIRLRCVCGGEGGGVEGGE